MKTMINLLPASCRRQQMLHNRAVQWASCIALVLAAGGGLHWYERQESVALRQELELLHREHEPTQTMLRELEQMRKQLDELQQQEQIARELETQRNALALLAVISQSTQQTNGRARVTKLELTGFQNTPADPASGTGGKREGLSLSGLSLDGPAVGELLDGLQSSGLFRQVKLGQLKEQPEQGVSLREYELSCEF